MIIETLIGCLVAIPISLLVLFRFIAAGFKLQAKERTNPPKVLQDKSLGEHKYVTVNGVRLHYVESGDASKPLILFVHGFPEFWYSWRHQIRHFNKSYHVVAFDMRGYGFSEKPAGVQNYAVHLLTEDIRALVQSLGVEKFHMVAHDWGGIVGWNFAAQHPDMLKSYQALNIPHPLALQDQMQLGWEQRLKSWYVLMFQVPFIPELFNLSSDISIFYTIMKQAKLHKDEEVVEAFKFTFRDFTSWNRPINYYRALIRNRAGTPIKKLSDIKVPVQQVFGTGDKYLSLAAARGSAKYVRSHHLELLDGVSHWVQQESPDHVNKAVQTFIKKNS